MISLDYDPEETADCSPHDPSEAHPGLGEVCCTECSVGGVGSRGISLYFGRDHWQHPDRRARPWGREHVTTEELVSWLLVHFETVHPQVMPPEVRTAVTLAVALGQPFQALETMADFG